MGEEDYPPGFGVTEIQADELNGKLGGEVERPSRAQALTALRFGLRLLDKDVKAVEQQGQTPDPKLLWILRAVNDARAKISRSKNKDGTFLNGWNDPELNQPFELNEGIPTDDLIEYLDKKSKQYPPNDKRGAKLLQAIKVLEDASDPFDKVHAKELADDPTGKLKDARIKQEANLISKEPWRASHNPDNQQRQLEDYWKGLEDIKKRKELILAPEVHKPAKPETPKPAEPDKPNQPKEPDAVKPEEPKKPNKPEKTNPDDPEKPKKPEEPKKPSEPEEPDKPKPVPEMSKEVEIGLASLKQHIEHRRPEGKGKVQGMELLEERLREFSGARMTEDREKWQGRLGFSRQAIPRFWKSTIGEIATSNKEKQHGLRLLAEGGLQMGELPYPVFNAIDQEARNRVLQSRRGLRSRVWGGIRDFLSEASFREKDLHRQRENIMRELRHAFDNSQDNASQALLKTPLGVEFTKLVNGDYQASEAVAKRLSSQFGNELIHGMAGETKSQQAILLDQDSPVGEFFRKQIIDPLLRDGLTRSDGKISDEVLMTARREVQEFFISPRFVKWYDEQSAKDPKFHETMKLSLSYGADLIPLIQETLLPQALQAKEHGFSINNLDDYIKNLVLKVNVGTLEGGTKGAIGEGRIERAATRSITNENVSRLYQELRTQGTAPNLIPDTYLNAATNRVDLWGIALRGAGHEVAMGVGVALGLYGLKWGAGMAGRFLVPLAGGSAVAGLLRGAQEHRLFTREHEQHEIERAKGYEFPTDARRREQMRGLERHKRNMAQGLTEPMRTITGEMTSGPVADNRAMELMGLLADAKARADIADCRQVDLFASSAPQTYQTEKTAMEIQEATSVVELKAYLDAHPTQLTGIAASLGINLPPQRDSQVDFIISTLAGEQSHILETGVGINTSYQTALGNLNIAQNESIQRREQAFHTARRNRVIGTAVATTLFGFGGGLVTQEIIALGGRALGSNVGQTILEKGVNWAAGQFGHPEFASAPISVESFTDLYQNKKSVDLGNLRATSVDNHIVVLQNQTTGSYIGAGKIAPDGALYELRAGDGVSKVATDNLKKTLDDLGFGTRLDVLTEKAPSDLSHIKELLASGQSETITKGPIELRVDGSTREFVFNDTANHVQFQGPIDSDGQIIMDHARYPQADFDKLALSLKAADFDVAAEKTSGQTVTKDALEAFKDQGTVEKAKRILWHNNATPGKFDGKELQFHHNVAGGDVDLDMSRMVSKVPGGVNWDNTIDPQYGRVAKDIVINPDGSRTYKNFEFLITPNKAADDARDIIRVTMDNTGHAKIPAGSPLRQFFAIENGKPVQLAKFIEVAHNEYDASGNLTGRTILATTEGKGIDNIEINIPGHDLLKAIPSDEPNTFNRFNLAATPPQVNEAPPIPIFPGRRPLEEPEKGRGVDREVPQTKRPQERLRETVKEGTEAPAVPVTSEQRKPLEDAEKNTLQVKREELGRLLSEPEPADPQEKQARETKLNQLHSEIRAIEASLPIFSKVMEIPEMFKQIEGPVNTGHPYFIANPPVSFDTLPTDKKGAILAAIPVAKPFFVKGKGNFYHPNPEVTPIGEFEQKANGRFLNAEAATKGDSGLLALIAASAETPEKQANLYRTLAEAILFAHHNDLLNDWVRAQKAAPIGLPNNPQATSLDIFVAYEIASDAQGVVTGLRPDNERLLPWDASIPLSTQALHLEQMQSMWQPRIDELTQKLQEGKLEPHHLRWIEFLSHSVDVGKLMQMLKEASPEAPMEKMESTIKIGPDEKTDDDEIRIRQSTPEEILEDERKIAERIKAVGADFDQDASQNRAKVSEPFETADKYIWEEVIYGPEMTKGSDELYRGYLMIEPEDMSRVLAILRTLGNIRRGRGQRLDFKWLQMTRPAFPTDEERNRYLADINNFGKYNQLEPTDPRIAIYGETSEEIQQILTELVKNSYWQYVESGRLTKFLGAIPPRRPGTNAFIYKDQEYRTLNFNDHPGYSENEAADPNWRDKKNGSHTQMI